MAFTPHPHLADLARAGVKGRSEVVVVKGLVAKASKSTVTIQAGLYGASLYEIQQADVVLAEDNPDGSVSLTLKGNASVTIHTSADILQVAKDSNPRPTQSAIDKCISDSRESCIAGAMILNGRSRSEAEQICDSPVMKLIRETYCKNPIQFLETVNARAAHLGAEIVLDAE